VASTHLSSERILELGHGALFFFSAHGSHPLFSLTTTTTPTFHCQFMLYKEKPQASLLDQLECVL
jgi:hypothetical protein